MSEPWIRVHSNLAGKKVVWRCVKSCGIPVESAVGHLVLLWGQAAQHTINGDLSMIPDEQIEDWAKWRGDAGVFAQFIRSNHVSDGKIKDWEEYAGKLEERRAKDRLRKGKRNSTGIPADTPREFTPNSIPTHANEDGDERKDEDGTERSTSSSTAATVVDADAYRLALVVSANQGMRANERLKGMYNPIHHGHAKSQVAADTIREAGVDLEFARSAVFEKTKAYVPEGRSRQVTSLAYCTEHVLQRWAAHCADRAAEQSTLPDAAPPASGRGKAQTYKIDAAVEEAARIQARRRGQHV